MPLTRAEMRGLCGKPIRRRYHPLGQIAYWPFDFDHDATAVDRSGNDNHGTIYGATRVDGKRGLALDFDGVNDRVEIPRSASLEVAGTQEITIMAWIYPHTLGNVPAVVAKREGATTNCDYQFLIGDLPWSGATASYLSFSFFDGSTWHSNPIGATDLDTKLNTWSHVAIVYDHDKIYAYLNGDLDGSLTITSAGLQAYPNAPLHIGLSNYHWQYFDGLIDEVRIFNRALRQQEIRMYMRRRALR